MNRPETWILILDIVDELRSCGYSWHPLGYSLGTCRTIELSTLVCHGCLTPLYIVPLRAHHVKKGEQRRCQVNQATTTAWIRTANCFCLLQGQLLSPPWSAVKHASIKKTLGVWDFPICFSGTRRCFVHLKFLFISYPKVCVHCSLR